VGFEEIDALLEASEPVEDGMPQPAERARLRTSRKLTQQQVADAVGVSRETVGAWEAGRREPGGDTRALYLHLLRGIQEREQRRSAAPTSAGDTAVAARPCVLCGRAASDEVEGYPQHLDAAECAPTPEPAPNAPASSVVEETARERQEPAVHKKGHTPPQATQPTGPVARGQARRGNLSSQQAGADRQLLEHVTARVEEALAQHDGDTEAATADLDHKAIPDVMALLDLSRTGGRYDFTMHPPLPDLLRKKSAHGFDDVWEARPKWAVTPDTLPAGEYEVTALDMNAAYLSAFKAHLPIGALEHHPGPHEGGPAHDKRRSGIHLITPPAWDHPDVPNPLGAREEPGRLWVAEPTLRLLQTLAGGQQPLCEAPLIHESWTSGSSEGLLEKLRTALIQARATALETGDAVTEEYVKAMYSKFVSTMGESTYNRQLNRPDWMHIIRAQAFTNLWRKALKARRGGLHVIRALGTDELHVAGAWRQVFPEGRGVTEVKVKDVYTVTGTGPAHA
jgi:DNA-binding XRE family transcriptional regulator